MSMTAKEKKDIFQIMLILLLVLDIVVIALNMIFAFI